MARQQPICKAEATGGLAKTVSFHPDKQRWLGLGRAAAILIAALAAASPAHSGSSQFVDTARCRDVGTFDVYTSGATDNHTWTRGGSDYRAFPSQQQKVWCRVERVAPRLKPVTPIAHRPPVVVPRVVPTPIPVSRPPLWPTFQEWLADLIGERG
ncbi:hypothetical protein LJR225_001914 [Phenylobacterium sp. LjRoot225]|uniref:hypothetical protein n=1 Tax=Phenylobacterium sp. LjRoot225 TaxID=3342285 RepID=UPI003ECCEC8B